MPDPLATLLAALDLTDTAARTEEDIFTGSSHWMESGRIFGGQVLGQSVMAAQRTIDGRDIHSLHGYFLRPGDIALPITFSVDRIHDGRSFSTRRTQAYQNGLPIFSMIASFQTPDEGLDHQVEMPTGMPQPEDLPEYTPSRAHPFERRYVTSPIDYSVNGDRIAQQSVWFKAAGTMPDEPGLHRAALAYMTDFSILEPVLRRHGVPWAAPGLKLASLDHAMWFHRFGRVDEWMLYSQESPSATSGRGLSFGRIFSRDGALLASVAQEGTIRVPGVPGVPVNE
jgi:acyl-CoA thioesterase-2